MEGRWKMLAGGLMILAGSLTPTGAREQSSLPGPAPGSGKTWTVGKTPDGQPDLQGTWLFFDTTPLETPGGVPTRRRDGETVPGSSDAAVAAQRAARAASGGAAAENSFYAEMALRGQARPKRPSLVVYPPNGKVPVLASAERKNSERQDHFRDSYLYVNAAERCITYGVPASLFPNINSSVQIVQGPGYVGFVSELNGVRVVPVNGSPHPPANMRFWNGDSRGHWEGSTLVVDVTNYNDKGGVTNSTDHLQGITQTEAMHVVERFTPVSADTIAYEVTLEDSGIYSGQWKVALPFTRDQSYRLFEYACHEGNLKFMQVTLGAGRLVDKGAGAEVTPASPTRLAAEEAAKK